MRSGRSSASERAGDPAMMALLRAAMLLQEPRGYNPARLYFTLAFMFVFVGAAVAFVRVRYPKRLIADIASTLGIFMLVIGTIVYTVAFRGLQPADRQGIERELARRTLHGGRAEQARCHAIRQRVARSFARSRVERRHPHARALRSRV